MYDQVRIESKGVKFVVVLEHNGNKQEMDLWDTYRNAENFAFYLARLLKLEVFFQEKKIVENKDQFL
ncbi:hypothetical protein A7975_30360 [Bacillus sp. FJAT-26390]|nr:hypothetical protein A7975_30360 [Bacillus sp. FJAT-26390]